MREPEGREITRRGLSGNGRVQKGEAKKGGNRGREQYCCLESRFERSEEEWNVNPRYKTSEIV